MLLACSAYEAALEAAAKSDAHAPHNSIVVHLDCTPPTQEVFALLVQAAAQAGRTTLDSDSAATVRTACAQGAACLWADRSRAAHVSSPAALLPCSATASTAACSKADDGGVVSVCYARVGLLGNPSDGFGGKTLAVTVRAQQHEFCAVACIMAVQ
ncbi:hypothetical protein EON67_10455 [archaeon]|nr:MAG: hypothetical protein EON67_10455 [archaeon]